MIALIYKKIVDFRNLMYDKKRFKSYRSKIPVVSVGNITAGGTGKTPFVVSLVKDFREKGLNPLIVSRGYGRETKEQIVFNLKSSALDLFIYTGNTKLVLLFDLLVAIYKSFCFIFVIIFLLKLYI